MAKTRLVLLSLLAVLVVSAVASASASAVVLMPAYTDEAGHLINGKVEVLTTKAAGGAGTLTATLAGVPIEIVCQEAHGTGWIENSATTGMGLSLGLLHYLKCTMPKPAGGSCKIEGELIHVLLVHNLLLLHGGGRYLIDFYPDVGTTYTVITVIGCTNAGLNGAYKVTGNAIGLVNNTNLTIEFSEAIGGELKLGVNKAVYTDILKTEILGGGGIMVEDGS